MSEKQNIKMNFDGRSDAQMSLAKRLLPTKNSHIQSNIGPPAPQKFFCGDGESLVKVSNLGLKNGRSEKKQF